MLASPAPVLPWWSEFLHPWHYWLTDSQNAAGVQAVCAVMAFYLVWRYTVYTRRMMTLAENTRRASITPVFTAKEIVPHYLNPTNGSDDICRVSMTIRNIGQGPAAVFWAWHQPVSDKFAPHKSDILRETPSARHAYVPESDLMSGDAMQIDFDAFDPDNPNQIGRNGEMFSFPPNRRWLFVVDAIDQAGGRHQLQLLKSAGDKAPIDVKMVHALGETFGERFVKRVARAVEILSAAKAEIRKLF